MSLAQGLLPRPRRLRTLARTPTLAASILWRAANALWLVHAARFHAAFPWRLDGPSGFAEEIDGLQQFGDFISWLLSRRERTEAVRG
jgi:hypothetical protein